MRQGPEYINPIDKFNDALRIPLELLSDFDTVEYVKWTANKDGTYTITLFDKIQ